MIMVDLVSDLVSNLQLSCGYRICYALYRPGQVEEGEADVEKADLIAKDIGDHQLADEVQSWPVKSDI